MEGERNCSVCSNTYENPKLLRCFHVYCHKCLVRMVRQDKRGQRAITCPECTIKTQVPLTDLPAAFHFNHHVDNAGGKRSERHSCPEHQDEELKLYCEDCGMLVCYKCIIRGGKHHNHKYELLDEAFKRYKDDICLSQARLGKRVAFVKRMLQKLYACRDGILVKISCFENELDGEIRKPLLMSQAQRIAQKQLESLDGDEEKLKIIQSQLKSCLDFMKKSLFSGNQYEVLNTKSSVVRQIKELTALFQSDVTLRSPDALIAGYSMNLRYFKLKGKQLSISRWVF